ncbi:HAMP domain-containing protein [Ectothiorhodospiraceae bacterium 2226]|nr:HAMP domain-containing protein [Ectothiorhodospiraceae bacterium 2226]
MGRLFWKIFFAFWLTLVGLSLAVGLAVHLYQQARLDALPDLAGSPRTEFMVASAAAALGHGGPPGLRALFEQWPGPHAPPVLVVDERGQDVLGRRVPAAALAQAQAELAQHGATRAVRSVRAPDGARYTLFVPAAETRQGRRLAAPDPVHTFSIQLAVALLASLLFSGGLAWYLSRPVRHLRRATRRLSEGRLDTRVGADIGRRRDEIADLGRDFDHMAGRLESVVGAQQRLLHDVSHELRSPLARLQVAVGLARQNPAKTGASLDRIEQEAERLNTLVGEVLTLSRLEAGVQGSPEAPVDLGDLLEAVVADARFEAEAAQRRVTLSPHGKAESRGRAELLHRAFENVIRNALQHTPPGTAVEVGLASDGHAHTVTVCDHGPGVPAAELTALFEPFYRAASAGHRGGFGLGLAIARRAVEAHGGRITARNRADGGLCVEIVLPRRLPGGARSAPAAAG